MSDDINYDELDPGVRELVRWIRGLGWKTSDSGDGVSKPGTVGEDGQMWDYDCVIPRPHVCIPFADPHSAAYCANQLYDLTLGRDAKVAHDKAIQVIYEPPDHLWIVMVLGLTNEDVP